MNLPIINIIGQLTLNECIGVRDGGTSTLLATDETDQAFEFCLPQHSIEANFNRHYIPGRLHVNNYPLPVRSMEEKLIVEELSNCKIANPESEELFKQILNQHLTFINSDKYLEVSRMMDKQFHIKINGNLTIIDCDRAKDKSAIYLIAQDEIGIEFHLFLPHHQLPPRYFPNLISGRLHLNDEALPLRSEVEQQFLQKLSTAAIVKGKDCLTLVQMVINFVSSDKYLEVAQKLQHV